MASIGYLIPKNPHWKTIHIEIIQIPQSSLEIDNVEYGVLYITMENKNLWHMQLVKFFRDGVLPLDLIKSSKNAFKVKASLYGMLGDVFYCRGFE